MLLANLKSFPHLFKYIHETPAGFALPWPTHEPEQLQNAHTMHARTCHRPVRVPPPLSTNLVMSECTALLGQKLEVRVGFRQWLQLMHCANLCGFEYFYNQ